VTPWTHPGRYLSTAHTEEYRPLSSQISSRSLLNQKQWEAQFAETALLTMERIVSRERILLRLFLLAEEKSLQESFELPSSPEGGMPASATRLIRVRKGGSQRGRCAQDNEFTPVLPRVAANAYPVHPAQNASPAAVRGW
jgi:hypothetical protein